MKTLKTLVLTALLVASNLAHADNTVLTKVKLNVNKSQIPLTTRTNEGYVQERLIENVSVAEGEKAYTIDLLNCYLNYWHGDTWYGIGTGHEAVDKSRIYFAEISLSATTGYSWAPLDQITVEVNGEVVNTDPQMVQGVTVDPKLSFRGPLLAIMYYMGEATDNKLPVEVSKVEFDDYALRLMRGTSRQYTALLTSTSSDLEDNAVTWSITGNTSAQTAISSDGILTIGADEEAKSIALTVRSVADPSKYNTISVDIARQETTVIDLNIDMKSGPYASDNTLGEANDYIQNNLKVSDNVTVADCYLTRVSLWQ